jgi:hypothetical protein
MSKKILGIFAGLALVVAVMLNVHTNNMNKNNSSKISLMNITALSADNIYSCDIYCVDDVWYICWIEFSNGFRLWCDSQTLRQM